jgi:hypothetical protein
MKMVIVILLLGMVISLGFALFSMQSTGGRSARMLRALTIRVVFSIGLIVALLLFWKLGYIEPLANG